MSRTAHCSGKIRSTARGLEGLAGSRPVALRIFIYFLANGSAGRPQNWGSPISSRHTISVRTILAVHLLRVPTERNSSYEKGLDTRPPSLTEHALVTKFA